MEKSNQTYSQLLEELVDGALTELQTIILKNYTESKHSNNICIRVPKSHQIELEYGRMLTEITSRNLLIDDCGYEYGIHILPISDLLELIDFMIEEYKEK